MDEIITFWPISRNWIISAMHFRFPTERSVNIFSTWLKFWLFLFKQQIMVTIGYAFMNKVISFYTFYRYAHEQSEYLQMVALIHFQLEIFWSCLVVVVITWANQVSKEVKYWKQTRKEMNENLAYNELDCYLIRVKKLHDMHMT